MPVYSMTGFASLSTRVPVNTRRQAQIQLEIRSVNGRFLDLSFRLPDELRHLEPQLRERVGQRVRRGKVEVRVGTRHEALAELPSLDAQGLAALVELSQAVQAHFPAARPLSVREALDLAGAQAAPTPIPDAAILQSFDTALLSFLASREREGERLLAALTDRLAQLRDLALQVEPIVPATVSRQQSRFLERWHEALAQTGGTANAAQAQDRALAEAAAHALRSDVAEELTRLRAHLDEIEAQLRAGGELGKRLDFLIQELHREANTLGSKSAALELSALSVDMKVLIEQLREQVQNIE